MWFFQNNSQTSSALSNESPLKIFAGIDQAIVEQILANAQHETFQAGETIMQQGDLPDGKGYIIKSGKVQVLLHSKEVSTLWHGEMFGEIALLNEEVRSASVIALENTECIVLTQDLLIAMIQNDDNSINKEIMQRIEHNILAQENSEGQ